MELVDGETLAQRLSKGPLPIDEALGIASRSQKGLRQHMKRGVIHRHLEPGGHSAARPDGPY